MKSLSEHQVFFDWHKVLRMPTPPPVNTLANSPQVLHFFRLGKNIWDDPSSAAYARSHMHEAKIFDSDADNLRYALDLVKDNGFFIDLGICTGKTINFIAGLKPRSTIYGFDSFKGLPEFWPGFNYPAGTFGGRGETLFIPPVLNNVKLYAGMFDQVLPKFAAEILKDSRITLLHVDCDLYSSTKTAFDALGDNIQPRTMIVFDEYINYEGWQNNEFKAFQEFVTKRGLSYEYVSFNQQHQQVTIRITR